jgi:hypothetical protein
LRLSVDARQVPLMNLASGTQRARDGCHDLLVCCYSTRTPSRREMLDGIPARWDSSVK